MLQVVNHGVSFCRRCVVKLRRGAFEILQRLFAEEWFSEFMVRMGTASGGLVPLLARMNGWIREEPLPPPFGPSPQKKRSAPNHTIRNRKTPVESERRSVLLLHHSYYHFKYLAEALRKRGWDAMSVTQLSPDEPSNQFFTGEDLNLYDPDPLIFRRKRDDFYNTISERFSMVFFSGIYWMGFYEENFFPKVPWDFMKLKSKGTKIGYVVTGCQDGVRQTEVERTTGGLCRKCVWQLHPEVCSNNLNARWGNRLEQMCDFISLETDWATPPRNGPRYFPEPLTSCLDPNTWAPDIEVPENLRFSRKPGELIVMHSVGNYETRAARGRDIKGSGAVFEAIKRLQSEGMPVRLEFATKVPNSDMRYLQVQADVIVDQLNYGRHGATTRQALMLGRPVITKLTQGNSEGVRALRSLSECPAVSAGEDDIYDALKALLLSPDKRARLGQEGREYAMRWLSADVCAARFERVYDRVMAGQRFRDVQMTDSK